MFYTISSIAPICTKLHGEGKTIVLATGFFDLLHSEHINFLRKAKARGDILVVAVESDERARILKGEHRPIETQSLRCDHLLALTTPGVISIVDYIIKLDDNFNNFAAYESLMSSIKPNIYAISSHTSHKNNKSFLVEKYGGQLVIVHDFNPAISTTKILSTKNKI